MSKAGKIIFWITFPLFTLIVALLLVFYLDLANGPVIIIALEATVLVVFIATRIHLRNKKFVLRMIPTISFFCVSLLLLSFAHPITERKSAAYYKNPAKTEVMQLANGKVQGVYDESKTVEIYAGIPFAKAPVGELRWKEPVDVEDWGDKVLDCSYFADRAMQSDDSAVISSLVDIYAQKAWKPDYSLEKRSPMSEDCLNLCIWKPKGEVKDLPILVYIHGGSLTSGSNNSEGYNGEEVAKKNVIMITIQYRLGIFGYFAHPDLAKESPNGTTGNYGLLDQIKALEWINKNAEYFGGDKNNITIAGESAGSSSVSALCSSPLAKGLFRRAIGESSSVVVKTPPHTYRTMADAQKMGEKIMKEFKCSSIDEMRKLSAKELLKTSYTNSSMTLDGYALEKNPYEVYLANENNESELLNGFNVLEGDAFVIPQYLLSPTNKNNIHERLVKEFDEEYAKKIEELYKDKIEKNAFEAFNEIFSVYWFMHPHYSWSKLAVDNGVKTYMYQFTKENNFYGTYHSGEIIYAYGNVERWNKFNRYDESDIALSNKMLTYWTNFAKTGDPNCSCAPEWEQYIPEEHNLQELGANIGPKKDPYVGLYKIIDSYIDYRIEHPKPSND